MSNLDNLKVGDLVDVLDENNNWCYAEIKNVISYGQEYKVHFVGWDNRWDEWISKKSPRLRPFDSNTYTYTINTNFDFLYTMYKDQHFTDITLKLIDGDIKVHKCILSAVSPVFNRMFTNPMIEYDRDYIEMDDIKYSSMELILDIIYGQKRIFFTVQDVLDLFYIVEKYALYHVKKELEDCLIRYLTYFKPEEKDNVFVLIEVCELYHLLKLKDTIIKKLESIKDFSENIKYLMDPRFSSLTKNTILSVFLPTEERQLH